MTEQQAGEIKNIEDKNKLRRMQRKRIHAVLANSYSFFLAAFLLGLLFDILFPIKIFKNSFLAFLGLVLLTIATILIIWAQRTSYNLKNKNLTKESFMHGPYRYTRGPTHWGLTFLVLGFGLLANDFFIVLFAIICFFITKFIFLKTEEALLLNKYGKPYWEYKKTVRI